MSIFKKKSLSEAVRSNDYRSVSKLVKKGINHDELDESFKFSIHSDSSIVKLLIKNGANVSSKNEFGRTPLHNAVKSGYVDITRLLIESMADINAKDSDGNTPLDLALIENVEESMPSMFNIPSNSSKEDKKDIINLIQSNGGVSGHSIDPQFRAIMYKRISALVFPARINFPTQSKDFIADKIEDKLNYKFPANMPDKEQERCKAEIRKMIIHELNKS